MSVFNQFESRVRARHIHSGSVLASLVTVGMVVGCSLQNFDELTNGGANPTLGGSKTSGGAGGSALGGKTATLGGASNATQGGSSQGGIMQSGTTQTGGNPSGGASAGPCPMYNGPAGTVVTPPSNDFETSITGWTTVSEHPSGLVQVPSASACLGSNYLQFAGSGRSANWDGPAVNVLPYLVANHKYVVSVAARFDPQNAPATAAGIMFSMALMCSDGSVSTSYSRVQDGSTTINWVRLTGALITSLSGCPSLSRLLVYVESDSNAATNTLQVDDFQLVDVTPATTGSGGAPGTGGTGAIGGTGSVGGMPAIGGATASGGAPGSGGADASVETDAGPDAG